ncbi:aminodeoxychorismate synthase component I [Rhodobacteraceae bacterium]|nr:aminodeoxychorismate synthase component I [Paracoccaceae bacterium]
MKVEFDQGPLNGGTVFADPVDVVRVTDPSGVEAGLERLQDLRDRGLWLAGCLSYELGYCFSSKLRPLMPENRTTPLIEMAAFTAPTRSGVCAVKDVGPLALRPAWSAEEYGAAFAPLAAHIRAGDCYQVNLTFPLSAHLSCPAEHLYQRMRAQHPLEYGAFVDLGEEQIISRSPELFFSVDAGGFIRTRPMKGTRPRMSDPAADAAQIADLKCSEKDRAENLMIVDLLRNDLSRLSRLGSVKVPELFKIESYATVHQMTSTVEARLRDGVDLPEILRAIFPCGSVTGAPKIRAMQIIRALEPAPRGQYCGAIGWAAPEGRMCFNVAIRTLSCARDGKIRLNVGGGVVYDSVAENEYQEALWKARFAGTVRTI